MIRKIQKTIDAALREILKSEFSLENYDVPEGQYPDTSMGDLAYTIAFPLAKLLKKNPKFIAQQIADALSARSIPEIEAVEVAGNGYLNVRFNRSYVARKLHREPTHPEPSGEGKANVEHTSINPNKAAHVGHLRNACLGDTLVRLLRYLGTPVEVQNYIDDTGVQLADVVVGFQRQGKSIADLDHIPGRIDYYFWDLYAETHHWINESDEGKAARANVLRAMEEHEPPLFDLSQAIADRIIRAHLQTLSRLGIYYELLARESDILGLNFWQHTFDLLKQRGAITLVEEGKNKGCWVMKLSGEDFEDMQNPDKVIVRSNGVVTYVGKDIAYHLWKYGLLGLDFNYKLFDTNSDGKALWTTSTKAGESGAPHFGGATSVYNVIDQRQSYLQKIVAEGLRALGYKNQADRFTHFAYEMVTLSPTTALELGFQLSDGEQQKTFVEMSGRKGLGVKADDLIDRLEQRATERIAPLYKDLPADQLENLAADIATGALRYFMIRYSRNTIINFDMDEALSFEGETGPYLQYSMVRARSIFRKLADSGFQLSAISEEEYALSLETLNQERAAESEDSWKIIAGVIRTKDMVTKALRSLEVSLFAKHVFELAQSFNYYYHKYQLLHEPDKSRKIMRVAVVKMFAEGMQTCLDLLGIPVPERM